MAETDNIVEIVCFDREGWAWRIPGRSWNKGYWTRAAAIRAARDHVRGTEMVWL